MSFNVLIDLLGRGEAEDDEQGPDGDILARGADPRYLLQQPDAEKEDVGVSSELFEQKLGNKRDGIVFPCGYLIALIFDILKRNLELIIMNVYFCQTYLDCVKVYLSRV